MITASSPPKQNICITNVNNRPTYADIIKTPKHAETTHYHQKLRTEIKLIEEQAYALEYSQFQSATNQRRHMWDLSDKIVLLHQQWKEAYLKYNEILDIESIMRFYGEWYETIPPSNSFIHLKKETELLKLLQDAISDWEKFTGLCSMARAYCTSCANLDGACQSCTIEFYMRDPTWHPAYYLLDWDLRWVCDRDALDLERYKDQVYEENYLVSIGKSAIEAEKDSQALREVVCDDYSHSSDDDEHQENQLFRSGKHHRTLRRQKQK